MRIFVMWSGVRSRTVAEALEALLNRTAKGAKVFVSSLDNRPGSPWRDQLKKSLDEANVGIACLTPENLTNPWIHFECGMIAKLPKHDIFPLLTGVEADSMTDPFADYHATTSANKKEMLQMVETLNAKRPRKNRQSRPELRKEFETHWPDFAAAVGGSVVVLDPDVAEAFRSAKSVNQALRKVAGLKKPAGPTP